MVNVNNEKKRAISAAIEADFIRFGYVVLQVYA